MTSVFSSESVSEGHPDKVCDLIADSVLDAYLALDPFSHVACEVLCKGRHVVLGGEIASSASVDVDGVVRSALRAAGYDRREEPLSCSNAEIVNLLSSQSERIRTAVLAEKGNVTAGDQGLVFGYATSDTPELLPLPIVLAHRITRELSRRRHSGEARFLRPDAKSQVSMELAGRQFGPLRSVVVSSQHEEGVPVAEVREYIREIVIPAALGGFLRPSVEILVNPAGPFDRGGPDADCGVTGRKIIVDTYGGWSRHGGGAFSGKDPTKVDRSAAYFARHVAVQIVRRGLAKEAEVQLAYAIGREAPTGVCVETFGTGNSELAREFALRFDYRPAAIIDSLRLRRPIYTLTTNYGHFGKGGLPWEQ